MATNIQIISIKCDVDVTKFTGMCFFMVYYNLVESCAYACRSKEEIVVAGVLYEKICCVQSTL